MLRPTVIALTAAWMVLSPTSASAATTAALWHMDDAGSVMVDSSGNGLNGASTNVAVGQPGAVGSAYGFQRTPAYVTVPNNARLNPGTGDFTVSAKIRFSAPPSSSVGDYDLVRKGLAGTAGGNWKMEILQSGKAYCLFKGSAGRVVLTNGPVLADNVWHTVSCTRSGSTVRLEVDGATYTKSGPTGSIANTVALRVGNKNTAGGDQYAGLMDEVSITTG